MIILNNIHTSIYVHDLCIYRKEMKERWGWFFKYTPHAYSNWFDKSKTLSLDGGDAKDSNISTYAYQYLILEFQ